MGSLFSSPKPPEKTEAQKKAEKRAEARDASLDREVASRSAATRRRRRGRASLISTNERGVRGTLG